MLASIPFSFLTIFIVFFCLTSTALGYGNLSSNDPNLLTFSIDKKSIFITLGFDRLVDATSFNVSKLHFQGVKNLGVTATASTLSQYAISFNSYHSELTNLAAQGNQTLSVTIYFTADQYAQMVMMEKAFSSSSTVYVAMDRGCVLSSPYTGSYPSRAISTSTAFKATSYLEDTQPPFLTKFSANMNEATINLVFSEPILLSSLTVYGLAAQIQFNVITQGAYQPFYYNYNPLVSYSDYQRNITLSLGSDNFNFITSHENLWSSLTTTYLSAYQSFCTDLKGNGVSHVEIDSVQAMIASVYTQDLTPPTLLYFDFNMNDGTMLLTFSETVNIHYFYVSLMTLQSSASAATTNVSLVSGANASISTSYSFQVNITFTLEQVTAFQLSNGIGTLQNATYVSLSYGLVVDMSAAQNVYQGLDAPSTNARRVRHLTKDSTRPSMVSAAIDLTAQTMTFTFSEVVKIGSLTSSQLTLQSVALLSTTMEFISGLQSSKATLLTKKSGLQVTYAMTSQLFNTIKTSNALGRSINNTFIAFTKLFATDMASPSNPVYPISTAAALQFSEYVPDRVAPILVSWYFDNNAGAMYLTFSEPVDVDVFDVTQVTVSSSGYASPATMTRTLTSGSYCAGLDDDQVTAIITLSRSDANAIKMKTPLCTSASTCYLTFTAALTTDTSTATAAGVTVANAVVPVSLKVSSSKYGYDKTGPILESYSYDAGRGKLMLNFDEPVLFTQPTLITLSSDASLTHHFTLSQFTQADGNRGVNLTVNFCRMDFVELKLNSSVATSSTSLFLYMGSGAIYDLFNNPQLTIVARKSASFITDSAAPSLAAFHYNRTTHNASLYFNDVLVSSATQPIMMVMVTTAGSLNSLTRAVLLTHHNSHRIDLDLSAMKSTLTNAGIGVTQKGTNLYLAASGVVQDSPNRISNSKMAVTSAIRDGNTILSFWLDLEHKYIMFEFVYPIHAVVVNPSQMTLQSSLSTSTASYTLTSFNSTKLMGQNFYRSYLSALDVTKIVERLTFTSRLDLSLSFSTSAFTDEVGYQLSAAKTIPCSFLYVSSVVPNLVGWTLDLGTGLLTLTFSKTVLVQSVLVDAISLASGRGSNATTYTLSTATIVTTTVADTVVVLNIGSGSYPSDREAVNALARLGTMATSRSNLYLYAEAGYALDSSVPPAYLYAIEQSNATKVTTFQSDTVAPTLVSTGIDLTQRILICTFSEAVNPNTNVPALYTLAQIPSNPLLAQFTLKTSNTSRVLSHGRVLIINISQTDFDGINFQNPNLCTSSANCFLSIIAGAVYDMSPAANAIADVFFRYGVQMSSFHGNTRPAVISRFDLSMANGTLQFYFSDVIKCSSLKINRFVLQAAKFVGTAGSIDALDNTTTFTCSSRNTKYIYLSFGDSNLIALKAITGLAKTINSTWLTFSTGAWYDVSGNANAAVFDGFAMSVTKYTGDTTAPLLLSYTVTAQYYLILNFNEPINVNSITVAQFSFQDAVPDYTKIYALSASTIMNVDTYKMSFTLALGADYFRIVTDSVVFTLQTTTYLSWTLGAAYDMSNNALVANPTATALIMGPSLSAWDFSMNSKLMTLYFSDSVNSSFVPAGIGIQNDLNTTYTTQQGNSYLSHTLTTQTKFIVRDSLYTTFTCLLSDFDVDTMKYIGLANSSTNTYLTIPYAQTTSTFAGTIVPYLKSTAILSTQALLVRYYTPDTTPPLLLTFDLSLNDPDAYLRLVFNEPVKTSSLTKVLSTAGSLVLLCKTLGNFASVTAGTVVLTNLTLLEINLTSTTAARAVLNTLKISYSEGPLNGLMLTKNGVYDMVGNAYAGNNELNAISIRSFTPDATPPHVTNSILSLGAGTLTIQFSEVINFATVKPYYITIMSNITNETSAFSLTLTNYSLLLQPTISSITLNMDLYSYDDFHLEYGLYNVLNLGNHTVNATLYLSVSSVLDLFGNEIAASTVEKINTIVADSVAPTLWSFSVVNHTSFRFSSNSNVNTFEVLLYFSEVVKISSFNCSDFVFASAASTSAAKIIHMEATDCYNETILDNQLSFLVDHPTIRTGLVFTSPDVTYLAYYPPSAGGGLTDNAGNELAKIPLGSALRQGTTVAKYFVDMVKGTVTLIFSSPVQRAAYANVTQFGFYSAQSGLSFHFNRSATTLRALFPGTSPANDTFGVLKFSTNDFINFKYIDVQQSKLYLLIGDESIRDVYDLWLLPMTSTSAFTPIAFVPDSIRPTIQTVTMDMSNNLLILVFDEPIRASSVVLTNFRVQAKNNSLVTSVKLTGGTASVTKNVLTIYLSTADMINIKLRFANGLCTSNATCFISFLFNSLTDYAGNALRAAPFTNAQQVTTYIADTTSPSLTAFGLDFTKETITFYFSEPVLAASINLTQVQLQNAFYSGNGRRYRLTTPEKFDSLYVLSNNSAVIVVRMSEKDVNNIKLTPLLARSAILSYLITGSGLCTDMAGNALVPILDGAAQAVKFFFTDTIPPVAERVIFNANENTLTIVMSEPVPLSSVAANYLTVAISPNGDYPHHKGSYNYTLSRFSVPDMTLDPNGISFNVVLLIYAQDMNSLDALHPLASSANTTWITFTPSFLMDVFGNPVVAAVAPYGALHPSEDDFIPDATPPTLRYYELDMNAMELRLTFSEAIDLDNTFPDQLTVQHCTVKRHCTSVTMAGAALSFENEDATAVMTVSVPHNTELRMKYDGIGLTSSVAYLSWTDVFAADYAGNFELPLWDGSVLDNTPRAPDNLIADVTSPVVTNWFVDRVAKSIHLRFSEPVSVVNLTKLSLLAVPSDTFASVRQSHNLVLYNGSVSVEYWNYASEVVLYPTSTGGSTCVATSISSGTEDVCRSGTGAAVLAFIDVYAVSGNYKLYLGVNYKGAVEDRAVDPNPLLVSGLEMLEGGPVCGQCPSGSYAIKNCTSSTDEVCASCSSCPEGMYCASTCTLYQDTLCGDCDVCGVGLYISTACGNFTNTVCSPCTTCTPLQYPSQECELGHDRICSTCEVCSFASPLVREQCVNDRYRWWAERHCCQDFDGNTVMCSSLDLQNMYITARNGRHHWVYPDTSPPIDGSGAYAFGKTWTL